MAEGTAGLDNEVVLPAPVREVARPAFPLVMALAPLVVAIAASVVLGSTTILAFAMLGPVMAAASYVESRRRSVREHRHAVAQFDQELAKTLGELEAATDREARGLLHRAPGARVMLERPRDEPASLIVGFGPVRSRVHVRGDLRLLAAEARARVEQCTLHTHAPILVDTSLVRISGPSALAAAAARSLVVQAGSCARRLELLVEGPGVLLSEELTANGVRWHALAPADRFSEQLPSTELVLALREVTVEASSRTEPDRAVLVRLGTDGRSSCVLGSGRSLELTPEFVSAQELTSWAARSAAWRSKSAAPGERAAGRATRGGDWGQAPSPDARRGLPVRLGTCEGLPFFIDLVAAGPHAAIGGTSGAGKSELLITILLALIESQTTADVLLLCFDFKGGATFDALAGSPHCVGVVTDLDGHEARRAALSLRAELESRELALRTQGARQIAATTAIPRLMIAVDEYQALVDASPELAEVFADVAARGRSLGMHLLLCAQHPATSIRHAVLANCALRISLRVLHPADSLALVGTDRAARLPADTPGSAVVSAGSGPVGLLVERRLEADIDRALVAAAEREQHLGLAPPLAPWLPSLPAQLPLAALRQTGGALVYGVLDDAVRRRQPSLCFRAEDGCLLVIGGARSGKSTALAALREAAASSAELPVIRTHALDADPERAWDLLMSADASALKGVLLIDDLDVLLGCLDEPHRTAMSARLESIMRGRRGSDLVLIATVSRVTGLVAPHLAAAPQRLRLMGRSRSDYVLAGGDPAEFEPMAPPGRGVWEGLPCQLAHAHPVPQASTGTLAGNSNDSAEPVGEARGADRRDFSLDELPTDGTPPELIVVARRVEHARRHLERSGFTCVDLPDWTGIDGGGAVDAVAEERGAARRAVLSDPEGWSARFGLLQRLAERHVLLLAGLTAGEHRSLLRGDPIAPYVVDVARHAIVRGPRGDMRRVSMDAGTPSARRDGSRDRNDALGDTPPHATSRRLRQDGGW